MAQQTVWIVYGSPAGTTCQVAETIAGEARAQGRSVVLIDLFGPADGRERLYKDIVSGDFLFVGSPTYSAHPLPAVMNFLAGMPMSRGVGAAPFVTYGMVTSGVALYDLGQQMKAKGLSVMGGIKVPAVHSMLWHEKNPLGEGRPDAEDRAAVSRFTREVLNKAGNGLSKEIELGDLNYQRQEVRERAAASGLHVLKTLVPPMEVNEDACTQCGQCVENCPSENISLQPAPVFGDNCILCFNCVRVCEPGAITNKALPLLGEEIKKRLDFFKEPSEVKSFL